MSVEPEPIGAPAAALLQAFSGPITRSKTHPLYGAGLAVVAFAMVLLPLIYLALILLAAGLVLLHLTHNTWMFNGSDHAVMRFLLYIGPAVVGGILVFFMVKPFFAARAQGAQALTLAPEQEPLLFGFVRKICALVGAPAPCRIEVDCQVNASARLRRGLWSRELVLTLGLPLVAGLDARQFAGVLAHEFGHFAQGAGMRLTYVIRHINLWFARVVYERDAWDLKLEQAARNTDWRLGVILHLGRGCVWLTRRILWALMQAGHAISCFMLRQMEFDADTYEAKVAGSDAFELTSAQLQVLNAAAQSAYEQARQSWASQRLPENLPLLIGHQAGRLPADVRQKLSAATTAQKTRWCDTHPCDADRVQAARRLNQLGVFRRSEPATCLFADFAALSKAVTRHQYEKQLQLKFTDQNLIPTEEMLRESAAQAAVDQVLRHYYGQVDLSLRPLLVTRELPPPLPGQDPVAAWRQARQATENLRAEAEQASVQYLEQQKRRIGFITAQRLAQAGFKVPPQHFGLPEYATAPGEQETAARFALEQAAEALNQHLRQLEPFMTALRQRVALGLQVAEGNPPAAAPATEPSPAELRALLAAVSAELPQVRELGARLQAFGALAQSRGNHSNPAQVDRVIAELVAELQGILQGLQERLSAFAYPFPHARGQLSVAAYARSEEDVENDWLRVYQDSAAHVERLFALHCRLLGQFLAQVEAAERGLEGQGQKSVMRDA